MENIPFNPDRIVADRPGESSQARQARLTEAMTLAVGVHRANLAEFKPRHTPPVGDNETLDAGRRAIWAIDAAVLELEEQGWRS